MWSPEQINSIQQNSGSFSRYWYSFLKLLFNRYQKLGVILCRLLLLFSKPQNGAEILFDPFSAAGYALQFVVRFLASGPGGALLTRTT
jgi:hypothetical protein